MSARTFVLVVGVILLLGGLGAGFAVDVMMRSAVGLIVGLVVAAIGLLMMIGAVVINET